MNLNELKVMILIVASLFFILMLLFRKKFTNKEQNQRINGSETTLEKSSNICCTAIGSYCKVMYEFYPLSGFKTVQAKQLYEDVVVKNLWIEEPFHTIFATLLRFYEDYDDCIKSENTNTINIKIVRTGKMVHVYKVYLVQELVFTTVNDVYNCIKNVYNQEDAKLILIATMLFKIDLLRSMSQIYNTHDLSCENILPIKCKNWQNILQIIYQIRAGEEQYNFINTIFQNSKQIASEHPYTDTQNSLNVLNPLPHYNPKIKKILLSV